MVQGAANSFRLRGKAFEIERNEGSGGDGAKLPRSVEQTERQSKLLAILAITRKTIRPG